MVKIRPPTFWIKPSLSFKAASNFARVIGELNSLPIDFRSSGATARAVSDVAGPRPSTFQAPSN